MRVCDYVINFLFYKGAEEIFVLSGGGAMYLNDAIACNNRIKPICMQHEQTMAMAVEAYAKANNKFSAGIFTSGPGSTNALTGLVGAWLDSVPCMFISGQANNSITTSRQTGVQSVDIIKIVKSVTKYSQIVTDPKTIKYHMDKAYKLATTGRPGPVWIDIPLNVQRANHSW